MNITKFAHLVLVVTLLALAAACAPQSNSTDVANAVALTQTAAAVKAVAPTLPPPQVVVETAAPATQGPTATLAPATAEMGHIQGIVHLMAPPTPAMVVYAVDPATGVWASVETQATDREAAFTLDVPAGAYQVFAAVASGQSVGGGYQDEAGTKLALVTVKAGQTVSGINVAPPAQSECGSILGFPPSPEGRFPGTAGPAAGCLATQAAAVASGASGPAITSEVRVTFPPNSTSWYTQGDLAPGAAIRFTLGAAKGQQMTLWLSTDPASDQALQASLYVTGADGTVFTPDPTLYWSNVLPTSQDYRVEIRSMAQKSINYEIRIAIPAAKIDLANGAMYDIPELAVCQSIQDMANQALGAKFTLQARAPFLDTIGGEAGQGCRVVAGGNGTQFSSPQAIVAKLLAQSGFTELPNYRADGPTGSAAGAVRDMALMLITATWQPDMGVQCPADKPIADCNLKPEQKIYTIALDLAYYKASFTLKGHWQDDKTGLTLDLDQVWKNITGHHTAVAQGGAKIDSLDGTTITGTVQGKVATVQFQSSFAQDLGTAQITFVDQSTITWKITTPPTGEYYLPAEATLTRK